MSRLVRKCALAITLAAMLLMPGSPPFAKSATNTIPDSERQVLEHLFLDANGNSNGNEWTNHDGWLYGSDPCQWYGVGCGYHSGDPQIHVTTLHLQHNNLNGNMPPDLGNLTGLIEIWLNDNYLYGAIPAGLGQCSHLDSIELQNNFLDQPIPKELGNLTNIIYIWLQNNRIPGSIPPELGNIKSLHKLLLGHNRLVFDIPAALGNLPELNTLDLSANYLEDAIPDALGNLTQMYYLYLNGNQLSGQIPAALGNLYHLSSLDLSSNQLTGHIPEALADLSNLTILDLSSNRLTGEIPAWLGEMNSLVGLSLNNNFLSGEIPAQLGNLFALQVLNLGVNQLTGEIPSALQNLHQLIGLYLAHNMLTGNIPTWLASMPALVDLRLDDNILSGGIPPELGSAPKLQALFLGMNRLTGNVPAELGNLGSLQYLWIADNPLSGPLPESLDRLTLKTFYFNNTFLCEPCSAAFQNWLTSIPNLRHTHKCPLTLFSDHAVGSPGSSMFLWGDCWPPNSTATVKVNDVVIGVVPIDQDGKISFTIEMDTSGIYRLVVIPNSSALVVDQTASVSIRIDPNAPFWPPQGEPTFHAPPGIGLDHILFLPSVSKGDVQLSILLGQNNTSNGMVLQSGGDYDTQVVSGGRRTGNGQILPSPDANQVADYYMQFDLSDSAIYIGYPTTNALIEVEYFDKGMDIFRVEYDALNGGPFNDGRFKPTATIKKTGSGLWKTASFSISDAYFTNRDNGGDFRIDDLGDGAEIIRKVTVTLLAGSSGNSIQFGSCRVRH